MMIAVLILSKCDFLSFNVWRWRALAGDEVVGHHHVRDACVVAAAISVVGFSSFGWTLGSTAERMAKERAQTAVVGVLAPICVEKFQHQADAATKLVEFNRVSSWDRRSIIEKGRWATMPGSDTPNSAVASACAEQLGSRL